MRQVILKIASAFVIAFGLAGCDKCGDHVKFNTPSLPNACGANADPGK